LTPFMNRSRKAGRLNVGYFLDWEWTLTLSSTIFFITSQSLALFEKYVHIAYSVSN